MEYRVECMWSDEYGDVERIDDFYANATSVSDALDAVANHLASEYPEVGGHCDGISFNVYRGDEFIRSGCFEWGEVHWDDGDTPRSLC